MRLNSRLQIFIGLIAVTICFQAFSQTLYSARGYWEELNRANVRIIQKKIGKGDSLSIDEKAYLKDFQVFIKSYYDRMNEAEKQKFEKFKVQWDKEVKPTLFDQPEIFELSGRDRFSNITYGIYYGIAINSITDASSAAATSIPLITGGLWGLGPVFNPKKFEGISRNTIRATNTGRFLGAIYGGLLGLTLTGTSAGSEKLVLGLSSLGSIALGEFAFQNQKKKNTPIGSIELMRHYSFLGSEVAFASAFSVGESSANLTGASLLGGGIVGFAIGNRESKKYEYTLGDVYAISSLTNIGAVLGLAPTFESLKSSGSNSSKSLVLIPVVTSVFASIRGQRMVRGVHLTDKQGSIIGLSSFGAGLVGLGVVAATGTDSPTLFFGIPGGLALITHQILFHRFKMRNLEIGLQGKIEKRKKYGLSMKLSPEGYLLNKSLPLQNFTPEVAYKMQSPIVSFKLAF